MNRKSKQINETSSLPFNPDDLSVVRLNQAQIAEIFGVSRQAVNQWIKTGKVSIFSDGTMDPVKVARELAKNSDPRRLKNKVFRQIQDETDSLRAQVNQHANEIKRLNEQVATTKQRAAFLLRELLEHTAWLNGFADLLAGLGVGSRAVDNASDWETVVQDLFDQAGELAARTEPGELLTTCDMNEFADLLDQSTEDGLSVHAGPIGLHTTCDMNEPADIHAEAGYRTCPSDVNVCGNSYPDGN